MYVATVHILTSTSGANLEDRVDIGFSFGFGVGFKGHVRFVCTAPVLSNRIRSSS